MESTFEIRQRVVRARRLLAARDLEHAEQEIEEAVALFPEAAELLALAADLCRRRKRLSEAQSFLKRAESSDPAHGTVMSVGADLAFDRKDYKRAAELYRQLVDQKPNPYHMSRFVQALNRIGRHEESSQVARQGLERYPDDLWLLRGLATAEVKLGRHSEAVKLYEKLLELDPNDRFSYKELMRLRTAGAPEGEAASALKGLMRSGGRGKNPYLKTLAADRLRGAGMLREAAAEYEAALSLEPGNAYALSQLGFCYRRLGDVGKAIDTLGKAFLADPTNPYVRRTLESMCKKDNRQPYLLDLVDEALKLHPDVKSLYGFRKRAAKPGKNTK